MQFGDDTASVGPQLSTGVDNSVENYRVVTTAYTRDSGTVWRVGMRNPVKIGVTRASVIVGCHEEAPAHRGKADQQQP